MTAVQVVGQTDLLEQIAEDHAAFIATCWETLSRLARSGVPFQAHDLELAGCPKPYSSSSWGALLQHAARRGLIRQEGTARSTRPETRGSLVRTWVGA